MFLNWYAVYTKPKQEARVSRNLSMANIEVFNPLLKRVRFIRQRYQEVIQPLFPCYIFARFDLRYSSRLVRYSRGVKSIVGSRNAPLPVAEEIIQTIKDRTDANGMVLVMPEIKPGDFVKIADGPLRGLKGIFEREMPDRERVMVLLSTIEYQARVLIEREALEGINAF
ncbi:MAG: hypothetical protein HY805_07100 [Nitrospirae bacterium]|nr:hypothetical protein [Nitrospirota bacterium]